MCSMGEQIVEWTLVEDGMLLRHVDGLDSNDV